MTAALLSPVSTNTINMVCPINWLHPLNRGLIGNWRIFPRNSSGRRIMNLVRPGAPKLHGTATHPSITPLQFFQPTDRPGGWGQATLGSGASQSYIIVDDDPLLDVVRTTWSVWIKQSAESNFAYPMTRHTGAGVAGDGQLFQVRGIDNRYRWGLLVSGAGYVVDSTIDPVNNLNQWVHLTGTYDGETARFYINGELEGENATPSGNLDASDQPLVFGRESDLGTGTAGSTVFQGAMDDARIWNRALSAFEVRQYYLLSQQGYHGLYNVVDPINAARFIDLGTSVIVVDLSHAIGFARDENIIGTPIVTESLTHMMDFSQDETLGLLHKGLESDVGFKQKMKVITGSIASGRFREKEGRRDG